MQSLTCFLETFSLSQQGVIHILQLLQFLVKIFIILHLFHVSLLLVRSLVVFHESNILLLEVLEFCVLSLKFLTFGSKRYDLLFLLLKIFLLLLELFLVFSLAMIYLFHLVLFLFKEILVIVQLVVQIFDFFLLLFELSPYRIILGLGHTHRLLNHLEILYQLIILVIHLLDPILQIYLLIIDNFLILKKLISLRFELLDLVLHFIQFVFQRLMLIRIARLELLNNVFVALDCTSHFLLEVIELPFEFLSFPLLEAHLHDLLVKVVLHELHLEEDVTRFVKSVL